MSLRTSSDRKKGYQDCPESSLDCCHLPKSHSVITASWDPLTHIASSYGLCPSFFVTNRILIPPGSWGPRLQKAPDGAGATSASESISISKHYYFELWWLALLSS